MKQHYPYRISGIFMVNAGGAFNFMWNMIKPLVPKKVLGKTFVVTRNEMNKVLDKHLGLDYLEVGYGGKLDDPYPCAFQ